ncbi:Multidrug export protein MepA [bioreactor metagenome]|uniref:Multidrug export protein MepA n=1 Tax=bioreactor metagenome TaxID=1076179 RepID=A0A644T9C3_9ZZZZ|nr:MATE family efflux transporter [Negativicutes bacterium]
MHQPNALGEKSIGKLLWEFSLPAVTGMMVNALYNVVDSIFVGNGVGDLGLAAVTIAFPIMTILMAFSMLVGIGATAQISLSIGQKNKVQAERILGNAFSLSLIMALLLTVVLLIFLDPILIVLGAEPAILPYARDFTQVIVGGSIFSYIGFGLNNIIRAEGNPKIAMTTMLISAFLNLMLNPLFIFGLEMGITGSALATVISQAVSAIWVVVYFLGKRGYLKLRLLNLKLDIEITRAIFAIGMSPFFMQLAASVVTVLYNYSLIAYGGAIAVAAMGIINRVSMLMLMPIFGISQGVQPIIGYNYGAGHYERVIEALKKATIAATAVALTGFLLVELFSFQITRVFTHNPELIKVGAEGMQMFMSMTPIIGFQIVCSTYFQAVGKAKQSLLLSLSRQVIILIPMILILPSIWGLNGIWLASPIADIFSSTLTAMFLFREIRGNMRLASIEP